MERMVIEVPAQLKISVHAIARREKRKIKDVLVECLDNFVIQKNTLKKDLTNKQT